MGRIEQNTDMANVADTAVVTGSSSGIGLALSRMLVKNGYEVFGFGRNFERAEAQEFCKEQPEKFHAVVCDITDTQALCAHIKEIDKNYRVTVLVNNAGVGYYGLHEELNPKKIQKMVRTNLEAPMILTQQLLRTLKKNRGTVINTSLGTLLANFNRLPYRIARSNRLKPSSLSLTSRNRNRANRLTPLLFYKFSIHNLFSRYYQLKIFIFNW